MIRRPLIAVPARFSASASALRYGAEVTARALVEAVFRVGGEPLVVHPDAPDDQVDVEAVRTRLAFADAVLLPGGGDISPRWTGDPEHEEHYDVDEQQDAFDLGVARWALDDGVPLLAICRGLQVVNVALGGTLHPHMDAETTGGPDHRHRVQELSVRPGTALAALTGDHPLTISCYHHQSIDRVADDLVVWATADDGTVEAVGHSGASWFVGVQWHPEDTAATDPRQSAVFAGLVDAAARRRG